MKLIIGGAYQGKTDYAIKKYRINSEEIIDGAALLDADKTGLRCVKNYHLYVKKLCESGADSIEETKKLIAANPEIIIIMNEIGNGIIPLEKSERIRREETGKTGCFLAEKAETVERLVCGICTKIK